MFTGLYFSHNQKYTQINTIKDENKRNLSIKVNRNLFYWETKEYDNCNL